MILEGLKLHVPVYNGLQVVAGAGAVNHDELVMTVEKSFQILSTDPTTAGELVMQEPASFIGSDTWTSRVTFG